MRGIPRRAPPCRIPAEHVNALSSHSDKGDDSAPGQSHSKSEAQRQATRIPAAATWRSLKATDFLIPKRVLTINGSHYLIIKQIGRGGTSKVYQAIGLDSQVYAIKRVKLPPDRLDSFSSFEDEIGWLQILQPSGRVVKLHASEVDRQQGRILIVLELGDIDLASLIAKNRDQKHQIGPNFLRVMWQEMLEAVQAVHDAKMIHGDLKPANFLFVAGRLKLIDFGISSSISPEATTTSIERSQRVGTINYMAPESLLSARGNEANYKFGRHADVWSLGCILYQLVYNNPPFPQQCAVEKISAICDESYEIAFPFVDGRGDFLQLRDVMKLCLQRDPKSRPTIGELLEHPYLTLRPKDVEDDLVRFVTIIQDKYPQYNFDSQQGQRKLEKVKQQLLDGNQVSLGD
jgi:serine/threonine-protein kinase TTK/MPS1